MRRPATSRSSTRVLDSSATSADHRRHSSERDTPKALKEYAERYDAGKGWVLLTGEVENLRLINRKLGNTNPVPESHIRVYLLGNLKTGLSPSGPGGG